MTKIFLYHNFSVLALLSTFILMIINHSQVTGSRNIPRSKRNALQLSNLVEQYTRYNPLKLLHYGNWCGKGGNRMKDGSYIDNCDRCCKMHDYCYREARLKPPYCTLVIYRTYNYETNENGSPFCSDDNEDCPRHLCECDMELLKCLSREPCKLTAQNSGSSLSSLFSLVQSFG